MRSLICFVLFATQFAVASAVTNIYESVHVGAFKLACDEAQEWKFSVTQKDSAADIEEWLVCATNATCAVPPKFSILFNLPQYDIHFVWHTGAETPILPPKWHSGFVSTLASGMPLITLLGTDNLNRFSFGASECVLPVRCRAGLKEENCTVPCSLSFFEEPSALRSFYSVRIRFDKRAKRWEKSVQDMTRWMENVGPYKPMRVPVAARDPLYSTWYSFTQDVSAEKIEDEAARAAALGLKTLILDDGWQTDEKGRAYERCGDDTVSKIKFPHGMASHVKKVQAHGIKYMVWVAVPFVGYKNAAFPRFKGKYLRDLPGVYCSVLDPRFPEVREYLLNLYARMQREWGVDGFKFDYIGQMKLEGTDPALAENFKGRDMRSVADAVDVLMFAILKRLTAVNPDVLIEYRQPYLSPGIRRFGNMIRAIDCPGEMQKNIIRTAMLRLTSGETAVHSDMLEWNAGDTPEHAAKPILSSLFSTIQYSVVLSKLPPTHLAMMRHWIDFTQQHRDTLLQGDFIASHPESNYPVLSAESNRECVMAIYNAATLVTLPAKKDAYLVNASGETSVVVELPTTRKVIIFDTFGKKQNEITLPAGFSRLAIPLSGYAMIAERK